MMSKHGAEGQGQLLTMGASPIPPHFQWQRRSGADAPLFFCVRKGYGRKGEGQGQFLIMGAKPPYPLYFTNRIVREESMCEEQGLCEHVFSGKMIAGVVCGTDRVHNPVIRVGRALRRRCCARHMELVCAAGRKCESMRFLAK